MAASRAFGRFSRGSWLGFDTGAETQSARAGRARALGRRGFAAWVYFFFGSGFGEQLAVKIGFEVWLSRKVKTERAFSFFEAGHFAWM